MKPRHLISVTLLCSALLTACGGENIQVGNAVIGFDRNNWAGQPYDCPQHSLAWSDVNDWYYQVQNMDYVDLAMSKYDLIVMDSEPTTPLNSNVIDRIRCDGDGEKLVLAYLPIGKAEEFRNYWQSDWTFDDPSWLAEPNGGWPGEYIVRYWDPDWKDIILGSPESRLDVILDAGFDGVVLDGVDVYQSFVEENPSAIADMHSFVNEIRDYAIANSGNSDFGIFVQNTEELINEPSIDWAGNLTGIIKLSHFYAPVDQPVESTLSNWYIEQLSHWTAAGKIVLSIDYATSAQNIANVFSAAAERGYVALTVPSRDLDRLDTPQGYEPD